MGRVRSGRCSDCGNRVTDSVLLLLARSVRPGSCSLRTELTPHLPGSNSDRLESPACLVPWSSPSGESHAHARKYGTGLFTALRQLAPNGSLFPENRGTALG